MKDTIRDLRDFLKWHKFWHRLYLRMRIWLQFLWWYPWDSFHISHIIPYYHNGLSHTKKALIRVAIKRVGYDVSTEGIIKK